MLPGHWDPLEDKFLKYSLRTLTLIMQIRTTNYTLKATGTILF